MNRNSVGLLAVLLLVVGTIAALRGPEDGSAAGFAAGCIRVGLVLAALWLALPQIRAALARLPGWLWSWVGKSKPPTSSGAPPPPAPPIKRPRRRSNAR